VLGLSILGYCRNTADSLKSSLCRYEANTKKIFLFSGFYHNKKHSYEYDLLFLPIEPPKSFTLDPVEHGMLAFGSTQDMNTGLLGESLTFRTMIRNVFVK